MEKLYKNYTKTIQKLYKTIQKLYKNYTKVDRNYTFFYIKYLKNSKIFYVLL
jgi:prefoldin subunit 5